MIAKNIGLRKIFFKPEIHKILMRYALRILEEQGQHNQRLVEINKQALHVLCLSACVKLNRFYIPGETSMAERLRKRSYDCGTYSMIHHIYNHLSESSGLRDLKIFIKEKVLNWIELNELIYHHKVLRLLIDSPGCNNQEGCQQQQEPSDDDHSKVKNSSAPAIWQESPQLSFPSFLLEVIDLE